VKPLLSPTILVSSLATAAAAPVSDVFKYFAGDWHCDGVFPASGRRISSRVHYDWDARTGGLIVRHDDEPPFDYHSLEMWAPPTKADAQNMIVDAHSGARLFTAKGWSGQTLTWLGVSDGKVQEEFVYTRVDERTTKIDWAVAHEDGDFKIGDTLTCLKQ
jgi:hypothetical protein